MTTTAIKERPILFSAPMVQAILQGRKTQTRRVVKPQPRGEFNVLTCPYGMDGDRLWVRETFSYVTLCKAGDPWTAGAKRDGTYREMPDGSPVMGVYRASGHHAPTWKPSIFMPRWASRITLEVLKVRAERLHDITDKDAKAEGAPEEVPFDHRLPTPHLEGFRTLWNSINAPRGLSWGTNPWVWVIEFRRIA